MNKNDKKKLLPYLYKSRHFSDFEKLLIKWNVIVIDDAFIEIEQVPNTCACLESSKVKYHYNLKSIRGLLVRILIMYYGAKESWKKFLKKIENDNKRVY